MIRILALVEGQTSHQRCIFFGWGGDYKIIVFKVYLLVVDCKKVFVAIFKVRMIEGHLYYRWPENCAACGENSSPKFMGIIGTKNSSGDFMGGEAVWSE